MKDFQILYDEEVIGFELFQASQFFKNVILQMRKKPQAA